jgi:hypothetical protein
MKSNYSFLLLLLFCACKAEDTSSSTTEVRSELALLIGQIPTELQEIFTAAAVEECGEFSLINKGEINIENNTWNATNLAPNSYEQCIYQYNNWVGWKWSYPDTAEGINAYPQLIYGKKPWHNGSTTTALPIEIDQIERLKAQYAVAISRNEGEYNLAFDNWISSAVSSRPEEILFEFMIWEDYHEIIPFGDFIANVVTPNGTYDLYTGQPAWEPEGTNWTYVAFVRTSKRTEGTVDIDLLLQYLLDQAIVPRNSYLSSIEFGTEIGNSKGYAVIKSFDISLE